MLCPAWLLLADAPAFLCLGLSCVWGTGTHSAPKGREDSGELSADLLLGVLPVPRAATPPSLSHPAFS